MIIDLVNAARRRPKSCGTREGVKLRIDFLGRNQVTLATQGAVYKMNNDEVQQFGLSLLNVIAETRTANTENRNQTKGAKKILTTLFGKEILGHNAITKSQNGFFFSLTGKGTQFVAWYAQFGSVTCNNFDLSTPAPGCVFAATCSNPWALRLWIAPFIVLKTEWESPNSLGSVWMGHQSS